MRFRNTFVERRDVAVPRPKSTIRSTAGAAMMIFGAVILGLLGTGGTYAYLNASTPLSGLAVNAGSMNLAVSNVQQHGASTTQLLPGQSAFISFDLRNVGDVPATVTGSVATGTAFSSYLSFDIASSLSCGPLPAALTFHSLLSTMDFGVDESVPLCLRVHLSEAAPQSLSSSSTTFTLTMNSQQVVTP